MKRSPVWLPATCGCLLCERSPLPLVNTSRFLQTDPVPGGSANDYDYSGQDPINNTDLDGRSYQAEGACSTAEMCYGHGSRADYRAANPYVQSANMRAYRHSVTGRTLHYARHHYGTALTGVALGTCLVASFGTCGIVTGAALVARIAQRGRGHLREDAGDVLVTAAGVRQGYVVARGAAQLKGHLARLAYNLHASAGSLFSYLAGG